MTPLLRTPDAVLYLKGNVTKNRWVGPKSRGPLARSLGFAEARLAQGWAVLVLKQQLSAADFILEGITLRSGGRAGLPSANAALDAVRPAVHAQIQADYGPEGYRKLQALGLSGVKDTGEDRIVKVVAYTSHDRDMAPRDQYPMGGGGLQWRLVRPCRFQVAMTVDAQGIARIPGFSAVLSDSLAYDARARLARHIANL
jgi:hypothetical protein